MKRRAYRYQDYWGLPVPAFGSDDPLLLIVGLAPGAHGANRTGRLFTGDSSGDWLYRALFVTGFANQARSTDRDDGLELIDATVTCAARCAPPGNRASSEELRACLPFLAEELVSFQRLRVILALGKIAHDAVRKGWIAAGNEPFPKHAFGHCAEVETRRAGNGTRVSLLSSYHPSRQNTQTGRLSRRMFHRVFRRARKLIS